MFDRHVFVAATRFGMGAAPGDAERIGNDPKGWLIEQLRPQPLPAALAHLPSTQALYDRFRTVQAERKAAQRQAALAGTAAPASSPAPMAEMGEASDAISYGTPPDRPRQAGPLPQFRAAPIERHAAAPVVPVNAPAGQTAAIATPAMGEPLHDIYVGEAAARTCAAVESTTPLHERLVRFWSNHFTVSVSRPPVLAIAGAFEREAIRPRVTGRFHDLLRAQRRCIRRCCSISDNAESIGPNSIAGLKRNKGLNEKLAREMLELHTLGVDGGYSQADVTNFARILTGWTLAHGNDGARGLALFEPRFHEPGPESLLGVTVREGGPMECEAIFDLLARHPATARFVATKLVRHFIADDPPKAAVEAVAERFHNSGGDLAQVMQTVIARPEAWDPPLAKVRSPDDLVIATLRALGDPPLEDKQIFRSLAVLGQAPWSAPSPAGWPDRADAWLGPEALMRRLEWARGMAQKADRIDAAQMVQSSIDAVMGAAPPATPSSGRPTRARS